jgi:hypothetical protein
MKKCDFQKIISKLLDQLNINYIIEYHIDEINKFCDYFLPEYNTIIEFYGKNRW